MKKMINKVQVEGKIYSHSLVKKTVTNTNSANYGKEYIRGGIQIAINDDGTKVVPVNYTYVTETTNSGGTNFTYKTLNQILNGGCDWLTVGPEQAMKVRVDSAIALNDFCDRENSDNIVSRKEINGGFITVIKSLCPEKDRSKFIVDMVIQKINRNINEETGVSTATVSGAIFNFRNAILPISFTLKDEQGINYFEQMINGQNCIFAPVYGKIVNQIVKEETVIENAWGGSGYVDYVERKVNDWEITGLKQPYEFGEASTLTIEEIQKAIQDREVYLAEVKKNYLEYQAKNNNGGMVQAGNSISAGGFSF